MNANKIAIIGANSYIARHVIMQLEKELPHAAVDLYDYTESQVDGRDNYGQIDIANRESVRGIDFDCDLIYLFSGRTGTYAGFDEYESFVDINEKALLNILDEYRKQYSGAKIIFPSTRLVYKGKEGLLSEDDEKEFKTLYAMNKYACENYLKQYNNVFDVKYCVFRICVPYGTAISSASSYGTAEFMLNKAQRGETITLYGDGSQRRTFTYIEDLAKVLVRGGISDECINDIYNVGGEDLSLKDMAELVADRYSVDIDYIAWPDAALKIESGSTVFDSSKLDALIGNLTTTRFKDYLSSQTK